MPVHASTTTSATNFAADLYSAQQAYAAVHGVYAQLLLSHSVPPTAPVPAVADLNQTPNDRFTKDREAAVTHDGKPTVQLKKVPHDVAYILKSKVPMAIPFSYRVDVETRPGGSQGYTLTQETMADGLIWRRKQRVLDGTIIETTTWQEV